MNELKDIIDELKLHETSHKELGLYIKNIRNKINNLFILECPNNEIININTYINITLNFS